MTRSAKKQLIVNVGFAVLKSFFLMWSIRVADSLLAPVALGILLLFRRQGMLYGNITQLGFSQSIIKYCGVARGGEGQTLLLANMAKWVMLLSFFVCIVLAVYSDVFARWLLTDGYGGVVLWFGVYIAGMALGYLAGSSWRSQLNFVNYNLVDWLNGSLVFVICLLLYGEKNNAVIENIVATFSVGTLLSSMFFLAWFFYKYRIYEEFFTFGLRLPRYVIRYGLSRGGAAFADVGTIAIGPWLLRDDPRLSGVLIIAYSFIRVAQAAILPVAQVFAVRANSRFYNVATEERRILRVAVSAVLGGAAFSALYYVIGDSMVHLWVPESAESVHEILKHIVFFIPAVCAFYALRNYVDLKFERPVNLFFFSVAIVVYVVLEWVVRAMGFDPKVAAIVASSGMFGLFYVYVGYFVWFLAKGGGR